MMINLVKVWGVDDDDRIDEFVKKLTDVQRKANLKKAGNECDDPECKNCGGTGWIQVCKGCNKPLNKHTYKEQQACSEKLMNEEFQ